MFSTPPFLPGPSTALPASPGLRVRHATPRRVTRQGRLLLPFLSLFLLVETILHLHVSLRRRWFTHSHKIEGGKQMNSKSSSASSSPVLFEFYKGQLLSSKIHKCHEQNLRQNQGNTLGHRLIGCYPLHTLNPSLYK